MRLPLGESPLVPVVLENPLAGSRYPAGEGEEVLAALDTGYTGFALVPGDVYGALGLNLLEPLRTRARTADGREIELLGTYAVVSVPELNLSSEGLVETADGVEEILLGMEWLREIRATLDGCSGEALLEACS